MNVLNNSSISSSDITPAATPVHPNPLSQAIAIALGKGKVGLGFLTRNANPALIVSSGSILVAMTGNSAFPDPLPALADIATVRNAFIAAVNVGARHGPEGVLARRQLRAQLVGMLRSLSLYVQQASNGDPLVLLSSGYPVHKQRQPAGLLPAPLNLRLARGTLSGQLKARCNALPQAGSYQWRYATSAAPSAWTLVDPTMAANMLFGGLVPGTVYVVQVRAVGTRGPSDWSDAASLMVV